MKKESNAGLKQAAENILAACAINIKCHISEKEFFLQY